MVDPAATNIWFRQRFRRQTASTPMSVATSSRFGAGVPARPLLPPGPPLGPPSAERLAAVRERLAHRVVLSEEYCRRFGSRLDHQTLSNAAVDRIFDYADRLTNDAERYMPDAMWRRLITQHVMLTDTYLRRDKAAFGKLMQTIARVPLVTGGLIGFGQDELDASVEARILEATLFVDRLVSLLAFLELIPLPNPELGGWQVRDPDLEPLIRRAFRAGQVPIAPPSAGGGAFGLRVGGGVFGLKDLHARYTAEVIARACRARGLTQVLEIGGRLGVTAYYMAALLPESVGCTIFDLPIVSLMQAYFLMRSLGEEHVVLDGEAADTGGPARITLRPFWRAFEDTSENALWLAHDSLSELSAVQAGSHIKRIAQSKGSYFLSVNQESRASNGSGGQHLRVPDLTARYPSLVRMYRCRDFLRPGWIEELYAVQRA